jgi:exodeoxyribonuclease V alpha subunit
MNVIIEHAYDFVKRRLSPLEINNDGKQTPMKGHPVFIAQHATGTCCRGCLYKWHGISKNKELTNNEINYIVSLIIEWIVRNMS